MEHIWQCSNKHTSGSFNIAEYIPGFAPAANEGTVFSFPVSDGLEKIVSFCAGTDSSNQEKDFSEPSGISSFRRGTTPGQALPLDMNQTSLPDGFRPELAKDPYHFRVAIYRKAMRLKSSLYQRLKKPLQLRLGVLRDTILTGHNHVGLSFHQGNEAARTIKECPIHDKVLALSQAQRWNGRLLFHIVTNHMIKLPRTVSALARQLSYRVTLNHPTSKPLLLVGPPGSRITPTIGVHTGRAEPALPSISIPAVSPEYPGTMRTMFFWS